MHFGMSDLDAAANEAPDMIFPVFTKYKNKRKRNMALQPKKKIVVKATNKPTLKARIEARRAAGKSEGGGDGERTVGRFKAELPKEKTSGVTNPNSQRILFVTPPGWGKTEWIGSIPDVLYLACEEGHTFINAYKIVIDCWDYKLGKAKPAYKDQDGNTHMSFMQALDAIEDDSQRFPVIAIDTVDSLVKMMLDFFYGKHHVEHAEDIGGYGKGWDIAQNTPFRRAFNRLSKTGAGLVFTTHENVVEHTFKKGARSKKETTLPTGIWRLLFAQVGIIFHGVFGDKQKGKSHADRILVTEGSEDMLAKNRGGLMPYAFIVPQGQQWEQFKSFFEDTDNIRKAEKLYETRYGD